MVGGLVYIKLVILTDRFHSLSCVLTLLCTLLKCLEILEKGINKILMWLFSLSDVFCVVKKSKSKHVFFLAV